MEQSKKFQTWMALNVDVGPKRVLTKAIATQVLRKQLPQLRHPAVDYVLENDELLSEEELARAVAEWSPGECLGKWAQLPGRQAHETLQTLVTREIVSSSFAAIELDQEAPSLILHQEGQSKKVGISEGMPLVAPAERADQYSAHKVAGLYLMINPPITKGKTTPEPLEANAKTSGSMVPKMCAQFRQWDPKDKQFVGPFETFYADKPTVHQLESVFVSQTKENSMALQAKTLEVIAPSFRQVKMPHYDLFRERKMGGLMLRKPLVTAKLPPTLQALWRTWAKTQVLGRVSSVYDPYFGCVLPNGVAYKVHMMANLKWTLRQLECVGVSAASECAVWTKLKSFAEMNVPISAKIASKNLPQSEKGEYTPGVYRPFPRALELLDVAGSSPPKVSNVDVQYFPTRVQEVIEGMIKIVGDWTSIERPCALVAYLDPCMAGLQDCSFFPLDFSTGRVIIAPVIKGRDNNGFTFDKIVELFARFTIYKIYYPYSRVPWPTLCPEIISPVVVLRNGKKTVMGKDADYFANPDVVFTEEDEIDGEGIETIADQALFTVKGKPDPTVIVAPPVPLAPKVVLDYVGGDDDEGVGVGDDEGRHDDDERGEQDEEEDDFGVESVSVQDARALQERQRLLKAEAQKKMV